MSKVFDYHAESRDSFLAWAFINLITGLDFEQVQEATDNARAVDLKITINGIECDVDNFLGGIQHNMEYQANRRAEEMINENKELNDLWELLTKVTGAAKVAVNKAVRGTDLGKFLEEYGDE